MYVEFFLLYFRKESKTNQHQLFYFQVLEDGICQKFLYILGLIPGLSRASELQQRMKNVR